MFAAHFRHYFSQANLSMDLLASPYHYFYYILYSRNLGYPRLTMFLLEYFPNTRYPFPIDTHIFLRAIKRHQQLRTTNIKVQAQATAKSCMAPLSFLAY
jgi:hypothetical protein